MSIHGLKMRTIQEGKGPKALLSQKVWLHYVGKLEDGTVFDKTHPDVPLVYTMGSKSLIKGFLLGIRGMKTGEKREIVIPPRLAYGRRGAPPTIPGSATLHFEVEMKKIMANKRGY